MTRQLVPGQLPRGIRNNKPGNIRLTREEWRGAVPNENEKEFITFLTPQFGIRAIAKIVKNYNKKYNLTTVREIIQRWAPPVENDTESYIENVCARLGVGPGEPIDINDDRVLIELVKGIIKQENGPGEWYDDFTLQQGVEMA